MPKLDKSVSRVRLIFLVKWQFGCLVSLLVAFLELGNKRFFAKIARYIAHHNIGTLVISIFDFADKFLGQHRHFTVSIRIAAFGVARSFLA